MRLAISNIAWEVAIDESVASLLARYGVDAIDIAPGKYFPDPASATTSEIEAVRGWWQARGVEITGMQSLLFGTTGLNVFAAPEVQQRMLDHLGAVCRIAGILGSRRLVFGSPKNRNRSGLSDEEVLSVAVDFFRRLGDVAQSHGVVICLEPNPTCYGTNFMTDGEQTAGVVERVNHPAIRMQFDAGAAHINGEDPLALLRRCAPLVGHVHASEPNLVTLGDGGTDHAATAAAIAQCLPDALVCIEMVAAEDEPQLSAIERALQVASRHYRNHGCTAETAA